MEGERHVAAGRSARRGCTPGSGSPRPPHAGSGAGLRGRRRRRYGCQGIDLSGRAQRGAPVGTQIDDVDQKAAAPPPASRPDPPGDSVRGLAAVALPNTTRPAAARAWPRPCERRSAGGPRACRTRRAPRRRRSRQVGHGGARRAGAHHDACVARSRRARGDSLWRGCHALAETGDGSGGGLCVERDLGTSTMAPRPRRARRGSPAGSHLGLARPGHRQPRTTPPRAECLGAQAAADGELPLRREERHSDTTAGARAEPVELTEAARPPRRPRVARRAAATQVGQRQGRKPARAPRTCRASRPPRLTEPPTDPRPHSPAGGDAGRPHRERRVCGEPSTRPGPAVARTAPATRSTGFYLLICYCLRAQLDLDQAAALACGMERLGHDVVERTVDRTGSDQRTATARPLGGHGPAGEIDHATGRLEPQAAAIWFSTKYP